MASSAKASIPTCSVSAGRCGAAGAAVVPRDHPDAAVGVEQGGPAVGVGAQPVAEQHGRAVDVVGPRLQLGAVTAGHGVVAQRQPVVDRGRDVQGLSGRGHAGIVPQRVPFGTDWWLRSPGRIPVERPQPSRAAGREGGAAPARRARRARVDSTNSCVSSRSRRPAARAVDATMALRQAVCWLVSAQRVTARKTSGRKRGPTSWFMVISHCPRGCRRAGPEWPCTPRCADNAREEWSLRRHGSVTGV